MDRGSRMETPESPPTQLPVQNFPDYLRYVMMKSMAGFGKVHDELYKLYNGASDSPSRSSQQINPQATSNGNWKKLRKRLSLRESFGPSTGSLKTPPVTQTFTSYILEEADEAPDSTLGSNLHTMASMSDLTNISNCDIRADKGTHSAPPIGVRKDVFKFDECRESMPHAELMTEAIYINDRVLHVDQESDNVNDGDIHGSPVYSRPIPKSERNETDDYMNLSTAQRLTESDDYVDMGNEGEPSLKQTERSTNKPNIDKSQKNSMLTRNNSVSAPIAVTTGHQRNDNASESEDEHDYVDPNSWTQYYVNAPEKQTPKEPRSICDKRNKSKKDINISINMPNKMTKNVPAGIAAVNKTESDYDELPSGAREINILTEPIRSNNETISSKETSNETTKGVADTYVGVKQTESDYDALPSGARPIKKVTEHIRSNNETAISSKNSNEKTKRVADASWRVNQTESDYDALPSGARPINKLVEANRSNKENNIFRKTPNDMTKTVTAPFVGVLQKESDYDVLAPGVRPINTQVDIEGDYDVPKAFKQNITDITVEKEYDIPKPKIFWKLTNNN